MRKDAGNGIWISMTERARVYGGSLYDLAAEEKLSDSILEQMLSVKQIFRDNPDYLRLLSEPSIKKAERLDLIEKAFGGSCERYLVSFLKLMCEKGYLGDYEGCCEIYTKRYNEDHNIADAVVTSAIPLTGDQKNALIAKLEQISGKKIALTEKVDSKVLAGIKVELEGTLLDGTVAGRISGLKKKLNEAIV